MSTIARPCANPTPFVVDTNVIARSNTKFHIGMSLFVQAFSMFEKIILLDRIL